MEKLPVEKDIIQNWKDWPCNPLVSICCITYNHERYIQDALDSFLAQKTDFPFEIIVNDDASTDRTSAIIRLYETKYPQLIKPIYQTENQLSQRKNPFILTFRKAQGKYIATCEGDDYWTDPKKLQLQVACMQQNSNYAITFHALSYVDAETKRVIKTYRNDNKSRLFSMDDLILRRKGGMVATASIVIRRYVFDEEFPDYFYQFPAGDYPLVLFAAINGKAYYIDRDMAAYRTNIHSSAMGRVRNMDFDKYLYRYVSFAKALYSFSIYTKHKYIAAVKKRSSDLVFGALRRGRNKTNVKIYFKHYWQTKKYLSLSHRLFGLIFILPIPGTKADAREKLLTYTSAISSKISKFFGVARL